MLVDALEALAKVIVILISARALRIGGLIPLVLVVVPASAAGRVSPFQSRPTQSTPRRPVYCRVPRESERGTGAQASSVSDARASYNKHVVSEASVFCLVLVSRVGFCRLLSAGR